MAIKDVHMSYQLIMLPNELETFKRDHAKNKSWFGIVRVLLFCFCVPI